MINSFSDLISHIPIKIKDKRLETIDEFTDRLRQKQCKTLRNKLFGRFRSSIFPFGSTRCEFYEFMNILMDLLPSFLYENVWKFLILEMKFDKVYDYGMLRFTKSKTANEIVIMVEYQNITTSV